MSEIKIRKMTSADLPKANVVDASLEGQHRGSTWPFSFENYWRVYEPKIAFAAEMDGELRGFIAGTIKQEERSHSILSQPYDVDASKSADGGVGWIEIMGVHFEHWGKGIGMALLNAFIDECKRQNASVRIVIRDDDENLKNFLNALKFKRDETVTYEKEL